MQDGMIGGYAGSAQPIAGYSTVSLMSGYSMKVDKTKVTLQLNVENLLDKRYYTGGANYSGNYAWFTSSSGYGLNPMNFGMPRTIMGSISVQF